MLDGKNTINKICSSDVKRASGSFPLSTNKFNKGNEQFIFICILEVEVRLLQDMLNDIMTNEIDERENWYIDTMLREIARCMTGNDNKCILMPNPSYRELRDILYTFAEQGRLQLFRVMRWRELTQFLTPLTASFIPSPLELDDDFNPTSRSLLSSSVEGLPSDGTGYELDPDEYLVISDVDDPNVLSPPKLSTEGLPSEEPSHELDPAEYIVISDADDSIAYEKI